MKPQDLGLADAFMKKRMAMKRRQMWRGGATKMAAGGQVEDDRQDDDLSYVRHSDTTGVPHPNEYDDDPEYMEFAAFGGEIDGDEEDEEDEMSKMPSMGGETTRDVMPEMALTPASAFHGALKRRPRRFGGY